MANTSKFALLFTAVLAQIKAQVGAVRYSNQDWGQLENDNPPASWPAVLIDFPGAEFTQSQGSQYTELTMQLRIVSLSLSATNSLVSAAQLEQALAFYDLEEQVYSAFQQWDAGGILNWKKLKRISAETEKREDGLRVRVLTFSGGFTQDD